MPFDSNTLCLAVLNIPIQAFLAISFLHLFLLYVITFLPYVIKSPWLDRDRQSLSMMFVTIAVRIFLYQPLNSIFICECLLSSSVKVNYSNLFASRLYIAVKSRLPFSYGVLLPASHTQSVLVDN